MDIMNKTCGTCGGLGHIQIWRSESEDPNTTICTMISDQVECGDCNGKGYKEYAIFSIDEAKAILKHCGLTTES